MPHHRTAADVKQGVKSMPAALESNADLEAIVEVLKVPGYQSVCEAAEGFAEMLNITRVIAVLFFLWAIYDRYLKHATLGEQPKYAAILGRFIVVFIVAAGYAKLFDGFVSLCNYIGSKIQGESFLYQIGKMFLDMEVQLIVRAAGKPSIKSVGDVIGSVLAVPINALLGELVAFVTQGIFFAIRFLRDVYLVGLRAIGPLFIGFYVDEKTRRLAVGWLEHLINVASWPIWMGLLVKIQLAFVAARTNVISTAEGAAADMLGPRWYFFQCIVLVLMILMIPTILAKIIRGIGLFR
jgi:hypothetical protein